MRRIILMCCAVVTISATGMAAEILCQQNFRDPPSPAWEGMAQTGVSREMSGTTWPVLKITRPTSGYTMVTLQLPLEPYLGKRIKVQARIKTENVSQPPNPWNGVKCMIHSIAPSNELWTQMDLPAGTFGWRDVEFSAVVPSDSTYISLMLGLELVAGSAWFDEITIKEIGAMRKPPENIDPELAAKPPYKGHDMTRLCGAMIGMTVDTNDIRVLGGEWGANHIRWQLTWAGFPNGPADTATAQQYRAWLDQEFARLDRLLPVCEELDMLVTIDLHTPPGGRAADASMPLFQSQQWQDEFMSVWEHIATRYKGNKAVWGYDLLNEPTEGIVDDNVMDWHQLAAATARRIRLIDADRAIIIEPAMWAAPDALDWFQPYDDISNLVYSVHMYLPHAFTHQGVSNPSDPPLNYPGTIAGKYWDKAQLRASLEPVFSFQRDHHAHIYIGEFSAIRWAPDGSAARYLSDCIDIFEEAGWDWAYHAFREWDGWSVEHIGTRNAPVLASTPTDRLQLLKRWFQKAREDTEKAKKPKPFLMWISRVCGAVYQKM